MARPRKEGMDYFPHDVNLRSDKKVEALRILHGNDGYAFYCIMLELIYQEANFELDVSDAETIQILAKNVEVTPQKLQDMIKTSIKHGCFDRERYLTDGVLTSNGIQKRASMVVDKRQKMRKQYNSSKNDVSDAETTEETGEESTQSKSKSKVKDKVKEKDKESKEENHAPTSERDSLLKLLNELEVKTTVYGLDQLYSFIGLVELGVIEVAVKKAAGKHINFALKILNDNVSEGKTKVEQVNPTPKVAPFKGRSDKPSIPIVEQQTEGNQTVSEDEFAEALALAEKLKADREAKERVNRETA